MSLRGSFASNLSRLCAGEPSIAAVCRSTKINRQQFSRYLSGGALPNERNLSKISRYFDIHEAELFRDVDVDVPKDPSTGDRLTWPAKDLRAALKLISSEAPTSVSPGYYYAHFAVPDDSSSIMRSVLIVRRDGNLSTFRRLTGHSEKSGSWWSHFHGDHRGVILERRHWLYFMALNSLANNEPTLMVLRWMPGTDPILGGHATIMTPIGSTLTAVVVAPCPPRTSLRSAVRGSHAYSTDNPEIDPFLIDSLDQQRQFLVGMVRRLDLEVRPVPDREHQL